MSDIPTYFVEPTGKETCRFWCPACGLHHHHGMPGDKPEHRVAHCSGGAHRNGYYIATGGDDA